MTSGDESPQADLSCRTQCALLKALLSERIGPRAEIPKYWHGSQVKRTLGARLEANAGLAAEAAETFLEGDTDNDFRKNARVWAEAAPDPSTYP